MNSITLVIGGAIHGDNDRRARSNGLDLNDHGSDNGRQS